MRTWDEFWPYYVAQHLNRVNRRLHFAGTSAALVLLALAAQSRSCPCAPTFGCAR